MTHIQLGVEWYCQSVDETNIDVSVEITISICHQLIKHHKLSHLFYFFPLCNIQFIRLVQFCTNSQHTQFISIGWFRFARTQFFFPMSLFTYSFVSISFYCTISYYFDAKLLTILKYFFHYIIFDIWHSIEWFYFH